MSKQEYVIKKHVHADSAAEALALDATTPVHEVFLIENKPTSARAIGFNVETDE